MENILSPFTLAVTIKLFVAMLCGLIIGTERLIAHKTACMRTYALVSMGAALFTVIGEMSTMLYQNPNYSSAPITAAVITGIGFLGTGLMIWRDKDHLSGLTSATGLWISAGIGMSAGFGFYQLAFISTVLTLFVFVALWFLEQKIKHLPMVENLNGEDTNKNS